MQIEPLHATLHLHSFRQLVLRRVTWVAGRAGLDSATTFSVTRWLRVISHALQLTTVVSLLQPSPEVFELFDDVLLLTDG